MSIMTERLRADGLYVVEDELRPEQRFDSRPIGPGPDWITQRLAVGGDRYYSDFREAEKLVAAGVSHIIDCRTSMEVSGSRLMLSALGDGVISFVCPTLDDGERKPVSWFKHGIEFALQALISEPRAKVFVHCSMGMNRGPSMAYAILRALGMDRNMAMYLLLQARPLATVDYRDDADWAVFKLGYSTSED